MMDDRKKLKVILDGMDVPQKRRNDVLWLLRNLGANNSKNPHFKTAMDMFAAEAREAARHGVAMYIAVLTACAFKRDMDAAMDAGADYFMSKPFHMDEMRMVLGRMRDNALVAERF